MGPGGEPRQNEAKLVLRELKRREKHAFGFPELYASLVRNCSSGFSQLHTGVPPWASYPTTSAPHFGTLSLCCLALEPM